MGQDQTLLTANGITKIFGDTVANRDIDFSIQKGELHALLGENGAGKSTLVKILYGALQPTAGDLIWKGAPITLTNPAAARKLGIGMVFQHFSLFEALTVAENIALAMPGNTSFSKLKKQIKDVSRKYGLALEPNANVTDLSTGERQRIEIVRCLLQDPELIIMDEPTSVLTPQEADTLFDTLRKLAQEGRAVLYISHRLEEVRQLCSSATILRHGELVQICDPRDKSPALLAQLMVGNKIPKVKTRFETLRGATRLRLQDLSLKSETPFGTNLDGINLEVHRGEIIGIAGIAGNGQSELFDAISGERRVSPEDAVTIDQMPVGQLGINERRRQSVAFIPEERNGHGAISEFSLSQNIILSRHACGDGLARYGFIDTGAAEEKSNHVRRENDVRAPSGDPAAGALSGGNLQKFLIGREMDRNPNLLVINQPTWGVDAGAAAAIHQNIIDLAKGGAAILIISQDLDEIFSICTGVAVLSRGRLSKPMRCGSVTKEDIGLLMTGDIEDLPPHAKPTIMPLEADGDDHLDVEAKAGEDNAPAA